MTIVGEAGNGREVLALAEKTKPDLIVMDVACRN
jgi:YesN/AraC family two-component response regulator